MRRPPAGCTSSRRSIPRLVLSASPSATGTSAPTGALGRRGRVTLDGGLRDRGGAPDDEPLPVRLHEGAGPGLVGAHLALQLDGRASRVEPAISAAQRASQRGALDGLRAGLERPREPVGQRLLQQVGRQRGQARLQRRRDLRALQVHAPLGQDGPGVEARVHAHEGHARRRVPGQDGGRHRHRPAMARQQRGVQVQGPVAGQVEHRRRDETAVVGQHDQAGVECAQLRERPRRGAGRAASGRRCRGPRPQPRPGSGAARPGGRMGGQGP